MDTTKFYIYRDSTFYATNLPPRSLDTLGPKSLVLLACANVVSNGEFHDNIVRHTTRLPTNLYSTLMADALQQDCLDFAKFLLSTWPLEMISLSDLIALYNGWTFVEKPLRLFWLWLDVLRKGSTPNLRVLDLRGYHLTDPTVHMLIRDILSICNNEEPLLDDYHIILDWGIADTTTCDDLMILLAMTDGKSRTIHLHFNNLSFHPYLRKTKIWDLLQRIEPKELRGLSMKYFSNDFALPILSRFSWLTNLRLFLKQNEMLPLHLLPRLRRLSLEYQHRAIASCIPKSVLTELEYLPIGNCPNDFEYLITVPLRLQEMDIECCIVKASYLHLWRDLFLSLVPTLKMLMVQHCIKDTSHFPLIVSFILPLVNLVNLDMCDNEMTFCALLEYVPKLGAMPNLMRMVFGSVLEEEDAVPYCDEVEKKRWLDAIEEKTACAKLNPVEIVWYCTDTVAAR